MDRRLRSTIARDEDKNASSVMHKDTSRNGIKMNRMEDTANMTGTAFANKENFEDYRGVKKQETMVDVYEA